MTTEQILRIPTLLIEGRHQDLMQQTKKILKRIYCVADKKSSCQCRECMKIEKQQHESVVWLSSSNEYTINDISIIFEKIQFLLEKDQHFFFIVSDAHRLTPATANRLLKSIEEPPQGYHFLFLTQNTQNILATIRSRCIHEYVYTTPHTTEHPLLSLLLSRTNKPQEYESVIAQEKFSHTQAKELIEAFLFTLYEHVKHHTLQEEDNSHITNLINHLNQSLCKPPRTGSSALFLKNIYITRPQ